MKRACLLLTMLGTVALTGCVERRFVIESVQPGAQVLRNGVPIGFTPVDDSFVYYGKYEFTLVKDGYETLRIVQDVPAPWYEIPPLDFVTENLLPFKIRDIRRFNYTMQPRRAVSSQEVIDRGLRLRAEGQMIGAPRTTPATVTPSAPSGPAPGAALAPPEVMPTPPAGVSSEGN